MVATDENVDTDRTQVQTYVPAYQKREWKAHAEELDMSLSEFVRSMVQAGRRGFEGVESARDDGTGAGSENAGDHPASDRDPQGSTVEERVVAALADEEYLDWDALVEQVVGDVESEVDEALQSLQAEDRVVYSGRNGGYTLA